MMNQVAVREVNDMKSGTFRLRGRALYDEHGQEKSVYQVVKDGNVNYTTILRWLKDAENIDSVKSDILFGYLVGLGLSEDDILSMSVGELFEFIPDEGAH